MDEPRNYLEKFLWDNLGFVVNRWPWHSLGESDKREAESFGVAKATDVAVESAEHLSFAV